jgi:RNA polymerase sigma factor (sigma-70 family)
MSRSSGHQGLDPGEDARLVQGCLSGDARAWAALVSRHQGLVYAVARSYRLSEADLGDVFQEVFAALVRGLPRLRDPRTLVRWLASTTERIARATALRRRREQALTAPDPGAVEGLAADQPAVGTELETLEEQALIRLALDGLPQGCRRLLHALYYEDPVPDYAALSRRLHMPIGSLGPTRARCIERMRRALLGLRGSPAGISAGAGPTSERGGSLPGSESPGEGGPLNVEKRR